LGLGLFVVVLAQGLGVRGLNHQEPPPPPVTPGQLAAQAGRAFRAERLAVPEQPREATLMAVGDIMLSRYVARKMKNLNDFHQPFHRVRDILAAADLVFGNLECPITPGREIGAGEMLFRADPEVVEALKAAHFSVLSLANNHTLNFGRQGLADTCSRLEQVGISFAGGGRNAAEADRAVFLERQGLRFAFLAYNAIDTTPSSFAATPDAAGTSRLELPRVVEAVRAAKAQADLVAVSVHHGSEYSLEPHPSQVQFSRAVIDAGADLVIGHHPHVMQRAEVYRHGLILYSLGNFVFDQPFPHTRDAVMVKITCRKTGVVKAEFIPYQIEGWTQPTPLAPGSPAAEATLRKLGLPLCSRLLVNWNPAAQKFEIQAGKMIYLQPPAAERPARAFSVPWSAGGPARVALKDGALQVLRGERLLWQSPQDWWVADAAATDVDGDGRRELALSVWQPGEPGAASLPVMRPHLALMDLGGEGPRLFWQSPPLARGVAEVAGLDVDGDGKTELAVLEEEDAPRVERRLAVWQWQGQGLALRWRGFAGRLNRLAAESRGGAPWLGVEWPPQPFPAAAGPASAPPTCQGGKPDGIM
jgi:poly-gamma-glutamate synthesis protein (capsule biosynthesis protein)